MLAAPPPMGYTSAFINRQGIQPLAAPGMQAYGGSQAPGAPAMQPGFGYGASPSASQMAQALAGPRGMTPNMMQGVGPATPPAGPMGGLGTGTLPGLQTG